MLADRQRSPFLGVDEHEADGRALGQPRRSEEHTSELQSRQYLVCRLLLEKNKILNSDPVAVFHARRHQKLAHKSASPLSFLPSPPSLRRLAVRTLVLHNTHGVWFGAGSSV